jgi:hypothetical protein
MLPAEMSEFNPKERNDEIFCKVESKQLLLNFVIKFDCEINDMVIAPFVVGQH